MDMGGSIPPDGHFVGWTPGRVPSGGDEQMAWRLDPGTDIVLQLHMLPTGKPETISPSIGLFFAEKPPARQSIVMLMRNNDIDIPPGTKDYLLQAQVVLPVPALVYGIYPHSHYLCRDIKVFATHPDGAKTWLIRITDWDFNWQDEYRYVTPVELPAGAKITMLYTFDNSPDNKRNPNNPPKRVTLGNESTDEMATLSLQLVPSNPEDLRALELMQWRHLVAVNPNDSQYLNNLGVTLQSQGQVQEAAACFRRSVALNQDFAIGWVNLGVALSAMGQMDEAVVHFRKAVTIDPRLADGYFNLAKVSLARQRLDEAIEYLEQAIRINSRYADAHNNLAVVFSMIGREDEAAEHFRLAMAHKPQWTMPYLGFSWMLATSAKADVRRPQEAVRLAEQAVRLTDRPDPLVLDVLAAAQASAEQFDDAASTAERAVELARAAGQPGFADQINARLELLQARTTVSRSAR